MFVISITCKQETTVQKKSETPNAPKSWILFKGVVKKESIIFLESCLDFENLPSDHIKSWIGQSLVNNQMHIVL